MRRGSIVAAVVLLLVAGAVADRLVDPPSQPARLRAGGRDPMPVASAPDSLSSTWYCPGVPAQGTGEASAGTVFVTNAGADALQGRVSFVAEGDRPPVVRPLALGPLSTVVLAVREHLEAPFVGAFVELDGGQAVVEHGVVGRSDFDIAPCASASTPVWHFATGATAKDATLVLTLFNPFPEDAIADLSFSTDEGRAAPADFQGLVVPAGRLRAVNVGEHVRRREAVATTVRTRTGRLVPNALQVRTQPGLAGTSLRLGSPGTGETWYFPDGYAAPGVNERYTVYNPSREEAEVDVELHLDEGFAEPFQLTVPPGGVASVVPNNEERVPKGVAHAAVVRSVNGVGIVAERSVEGAPPGPRTGRSDVVGARRTSRRWALAAGVTNESFDEWVVLQNPGDREARVSVLALAEGRTIPVEGLQDVAVPPGRRVAVRLGEHIRREPLPVVVEATAPVVVERSLFTTGAPGFAHTVGIPLE